MECTAAVSIAPQTEVISPLILGKQKNPDEYDFENERAPKRPSVKGLGAYRLSGRPASASYSPHMKPVLPQVAAVSLDGSKDSPQAQYSTAQVDRLIDQVMSWIKDERAKRAARELEKEIGSGEVSKNPAQSVPPDPSPDLDKLEEILKQTLSLKGLPSRRSIASLRHRPSLKKLHQRKASTASSDTEYFDNEILVPSCDAILDNSKTLAYTGGASDKSDGSSDDELTRVGSYRDQDAWSKFKFEIVRLTHTLRLRGWRRVPMELCTAVHVQRLSGALTNAVYVVSPPTDLPPRGQTGAEGSNVPKARTPPPKLLLRIYGPQVEHLIDREAELAILRRLAKQRIGPRLLGTFANGRFEEYFHAKTLTAEDIRNADTSRQIAKRMRELHEGIELLEQERDDGPFVWRNWDKWIDRVERIVTWLDSQIEALDPSVKPTGAEAWKRRGYICGVPWKIFRQTVEKYRAWLLDQYGGTMKLKDKLVFAHNDTQYGNILRFIPSGDSPLLHPLNSHKQLVVIDFEYANANMVGLEFANHFTEWCYNYHDTRKPYACNTNRYPTPEEQNRFLRAYVRHRPQFNVSTPRMTPEILPSGSATPTENPRLRPTTSISDFFLDARTPAADNSSNANPTYDEKLEKENEDMEVARLSHETRLWRLANTAQWVAWGIVQAKVPDMPAFSTPKDTHLEDQVTRDLAEDAKGYKELAREESPAKEEEQDEEFDYLGYAQHRAMFFWGDAVQMGIIEESELPEEVKQTMKKVPY